MAHFSSFPPSRRFCWLGAARGLLVGVLWVFSVLLPAQAAPQSVVLYAADGGLALAGSMGVLVDDGGQLTLDDVRSRRGQDRFTFPEALSTQGGDAHPVWFLIRLQQGEPSGDWVLSSGATSVQDMLFYGPFDASGRTTREAVFTGSQRPFATRPLSSENLSLRLHALEKGEYTLYVRAVSLTPRKYDFRIWDIEGFYAAGLNKRIFDGLCYGILLAMLVYNLVLLLVFRDRNYALYVLTGGFAFLCLLSFNGHLAHYLIPDMPVVSDRLNVVLPAIWIFFGALFAYSFLDLRRYAPSVGRAVLLVAALALVAALLGAIGQHTLGQATNEYLSLVGTVVALSGALLSWYRGFLPARWYLCGQVALFSTVFATVLHNWGYVRWPFLADNGLQIGVCVEVMVFAMALSSRIRMMQLVQAELKVRTEQLTVVSETDPLTGVANRAGLASRARAVLQHPHERTLILLDLDKFKPINDEHGHEAGDVVLVEISRRIQAQLRDDDTVARVGGDEFVVLLSRALEREAVAHICVRLLETIAQPVPFAGKALVVGGSLGIARFPDNGQALPDLMQAADVAMYHNKRKGRAGYAFFDELTDQDAQTAAQSLAGAVDKPNDAEFWGA